MLSKEYQAQLDAIAYEVQKSPKILRDEFRRLYGIEQMVFAHSVRRGATGKPLCTISSGPESVQCGTCVFCYIRQMEEWLDEAYSLSRHAQPV